MSFEQYWRSAYSNCPVMSCQLRNVFPQRWVRFHSLPESKRYAENESEYQIILQRHNAVLDYLARSGELLWLISTELGDAAGPTRRSAIVEFDPVAEFILTCKSDPESDELPYRFLYRSEWHWNPCTFDSILRLVADWLVTNVMILSPGGNWIYAPYDGGADCILPNEEERNQLAHRFADWLSNHPEGL